MRLIKNVLKQVLPNKKNIIKDGVEKQETSRINESFNFHKLSLEELEAYLNTSLKHGLDESKAGKLLLENGKNRITQKRKNPFFKIIGYFFSGFCILLWLAAITCIIAWKPLGNPSDPANLGLGILLIIVILLQAAFTAFQDWSSSKVMNSIKNMMPESARIIREGIEHKIPVENLVVGDLVNLDYGNKVPADLRIIESHDLKFDNSILTGESEPVEATIGETHENYLESKNIAYMTTLIISGQGKGVVVSTGDKTVMGRIASLTNETNEKPTSLQIELKRFVYVISSLAIFVAAVVIIVWSTWLRVSYPNYINVPTLLVNTITVMIAFIPEGLPICVTLSMLIIARRMAKNRVLVKNLSVIETLSCVNVIASDKTGTLTQNKMFVVNSAAGFEIVSSDDKKKEHRTKAFDQLIGACGLCNNASFCENEEKNDQIRQRKANGDATDIALLKYAAENDDLEKLKKNFFTLAEIPFNSKNKWMIKIIKAKNDQINSAYFNCNQNMDSVILLKGAPDYLIKKSTHFLHTDGTNQIMTDEKINKIIQIQNEWSGCGQRVLVLCKKECNFDETPKSSNELENYIHQTNDFCLIGLVGIIDPPREGISDVISKCKLGGIKVCMVTGDYALTAAAIAFQIGIFTKNEFDTVETMKQNKKIKNSLLLTGSDLENFKQDDWRLVTGYNEIVFARTTPEQKLNVVKEFQHDKYVVAVTGDGVNDAPALKRADIGIAMGGGSQVAIEAAHLVLLDNNFSSIIVAIKNGRLVYANLKKVILYLLPGGCMAELVSVLMSIFLGVPQNLSSFQMIIISLFTDISPSLSLMMEKEEVNLMTQPPRLINDHIVDWKFMLQAYLFLGPFISFFSQTMFFIYMQTQAMLKPQDILLSFGSFLTDNTEAQNSLSNQEYFYRGQTVTFLSIVILQVFGNLLSTRTHYKSIIQMPPWSRNGRNLWIFVAQIVSLTIMIIIIFVPFFNDLFMTRYIPAEFVFLPFAFVFAIIFLEEIRKLFVRKKILYFHKIGW